MHWEASDNSQPNTLHAAKTMNALSNGHRLTVLERSIVALLRKQTYTVHLGTLDNAGPKRTSLTPLPRCKTSTFHFKLS